MTHEDRIPMKMTVHTGRTFRLNKGWWRVDHPSFLSASMIYNWQGPVHQMDLGMNFHMDPIIVGLWFRGIPLRKNVIGNYSRDALVFSSGLKFDEITFQYSYDFTVSELGVRSQGAHEVSIVYQFLTPVNPKRVPHSKKFLPCPSYIPYESYKPRK